MARSYPNHLLSHSLIDVIDYALAIFMTVVGAVILLFYRTEVTATTSAYGVINSLPGPNHLWGIFALAFGIVLLIGAITGRRAWLFWGAFWSGAWSVLFSIGFFVLASNNDGAGTLHALSWVMFAVLYCIWAVGRSKRFVTKPL